VACHVLRPPAQAGFFGTAGPNGDARSGAIVKLLTLFGGCVWRPCDVAAILRDRGEDDLADLAQ